MSEMVERDSGIVACVEAALQKTADPPGVKNLEETALAAINAVYAYIDKQVAALEEPEE